LYVGSNRRIRVVPAGDGNSVCHETAPSFVVPFRSRRMPAARRTKPLNAQGFCAELSLPDRSGPSRDAWRTFRNVRNHRRCARAGANVAVRSAHLPLVWVVAATSVRKGGASLTGACGPTRSSSVGTVNAFQTRRTGRAFTIVEAVTVLAIMSILAMAAVAGMRTLTAEVDERTAENTLQSVAGAQILYYDSRGSWATSAAQLEGLGDGTIVLTEDPAYDDTTVSVAVLDGDLVLATTFTGGCLSLRVAPPDASLVYLPLVFAAAEDGGCDASLVTV